MRDVTRAAEGAADVGLSAELPETWAGPQLPKTHSPSEPGHLCCGSNPKVKLVGLAEG